MKPAPCRENTHLHRVVEAFQPGGEDPAQGTVSERDGSPLSPFRSHCSSSPSCIKSERAERETGQVKTAAV